MGRGKPKNPKDEYEVIGLGKPNEVSKSPWEYKVSKRVKEAQGKQMGQGCPREKGTQEPIGKKAHGRVKPLGKEYTAGPKGPDMIKSLQQEWQENMAEHDDNQEMGWKKYKAQYQREPTP